MAGTGAVDIYRLLLQRGQATGILPLCAGTGAGYRQVCYCCSNGHVSPDGKRLTCDRRVILQCITASVVSRISKPSCEPMFCSLFKTSCPGRFSRTSRSLFQPCQYFGITWTPSRQYIFSTSKEGTAAISAPKAGPSGELSASSQEV